MELCRWVTGHHFTLHHQGARWNCVVEWRVIILSCTTRVRDGIVSLSDGSSFYPAPPGCEMELCRWVTGHHFTLHHQGARWNCVVEWRVIILPCTTRVRDGIVSLSDGSSFYPAPLGCEMELCRWVTGHHFTLHHQGARWKCVIEWRVIILPCTTRVRDGIVSLSDGSSFYPAPPGCEMELCRWVTGHHFTLHHQGARWNCVVEWRVIILPCTTRVRDGIVSLSDGSSFYPAPPGCEMELCRWVTGHHFTLHHQGARWNCVFEWRVIILPCTTRVRDGIVSLSDGSSFYPAPPGCEMELCRWVTGHHFTLHHQGARWNCVVEWRVIILPCTTRVRDGTVSLSDGSSFYPAPPGCEMELCLWVTGHHFNLHHQGARWNCVVEWRVIILPCTTRVRDGIVSLSDGSSFYPAPPGCEMELCRWVTGHHFTLHHQGARWNCVVEWRVIILPCTTRVRDGNVSLSDGSAFYCLQFYFLIEI